MNLKWEKRVSVKGWTLKATLEQTFCNLDSFIPEHTRVNFCGERCISGLCNDFDLQTRTQTILEFEELERDQFESRMSDLEEKGWKIVQEESELPEAVEAQRMKQKQ